MTDLDLVAEQLWIAAGVPLSDDVRAAAIAAASPTRHAVEVRLAAEDPARDFAPTPGTIGSWVMPSGPGVRVDTAIGPGERVPPDYDPMIAKIMAVGRDRPAALRRLRRALDEVEVTGIQTTLPFDRALVRDPRFLAGDELAIDWVERYWDGPAARAASIERRPGGGCAGRHGDGARCPDIDGSEAAVGVFAQRRRGRVARPRGDAPGSSGGGDDDRSPSAPRDECSDHGAAGR